MVGSTGPTGAPGANGSPDSAADVLAKLVTVDGAGSGLDADTVGGIASTDLVVQRARFISIPLVSGLLTSTTFANGYITYPSTPDATLRFRMQLPPDYVAGSEVKVVLGGGVPGTPGDCALAMVVYMTVARAGQMNNVSGLEGPIQVVPAHVAENAMLSLPLPSSVPLLPYDFLSVDVSRLGDSSVADDCPNLIIADINVEYLSR